MASSRGDLTVTKTMKMTLFQALKILMRLNRHYVNDWYKKMYRFHKEEFADIMLEHCKITQGDPELYLAKRTVAQHIIKTRT